MKRSAKPGPAVAGGRAHPLGDDDQVGAQDAAPHRLTPALQAYQDWMRPLVDGVQRTPAALVRFAYPRTRLGLAVRGVADRLLTASLLRVLVTRLSRVDGTERHLPELVDVQAAGRRAAVAQPRDEARDVSAD